MQKNNGDFMKYYSVENYGALADGVTNDAKAIQSAIDDAEKTAAERLFSKAERHIIQAQS